MKQKLDINYMALPAVTTSLANLGLPAMSPTSAESERTCSETDTPICGITPAQHMRRIGASSASPMPFNLSDSIKTEIANVEEIGKLSSREAKIERIEGMLQSVSHISSHVESILEGREQLLVMKQIVHDFRAPLHNIAQTLVLLKDRLNDDDEYLKRLKASYEYLKLIASVVENPSKNGVENAEARRVDGILEIVEHLTKDCGKDKNVQVTVDLVKSDLSINCDALKIIQILVNLISNAVKASSENSSVWLRPAISPLSDEAVHIAFSVVDQGCGVAPDQVGELFKEKQTLLVAVPQTGGMRSSGLGLPASQKLAQVIRAEIKVTSEKGKGSTFTLESRFKKKEPEAPMAPSPMPPTPSPMRVSQLVRFDYPIALLAADDDGTTQRAYARMFPNAGVDRLFICASGEEALAAFKKDRYDFVILDQNMGKGLTGDATAVQMAAQNKFPKPFIAIISGDTDLPNPSEALMWTKPVSALVNKINQVLHLHISNIVGEHIEQNTARLVVSYLNGSV